ncbi:hypothetical protein ACFY64_39470 [Streptomyces collinus]|uniref:hypothetical protein n=1 Tax=Streptomyces collinus TaxID=42684 RepID=UPI0036C3BFAC
MRQFRRNLAWYIARRPGGLIALAIQYGHMRTIVDVRTSSGYGSRSRGGIEHDRRQHLPVAMLKPTTP